MTTTEAPAESKPKAKTKLEVEAELADLHKKMAQEAERFDAELADALATISELQAGRGGEVDNSLSVFEAWSAVMSDVQSVSKDSRNTQQNFNFRGIDAVMNTVGPALRRHGVMVIPEAVSETAERYETAPKANATRGTAMVNRLVEVRFRVFGPRGDYFTGSAFGEAADSGDKAMSKAHSVAYRTFLLQALTIPTDEPDPDASAHERTAPARTAGSRNDEAQAAPPQEQKSPADVARDGLRTLAEAKGWELKVVAEKFSTAMRPDGQERPVDLRQASAIDVNAFRNLLETGAITL